MSAIANRQSRIESLVEWAKTQGFEKQMEEPFGEENVFKKIRVHAMSEFYVSRKKGAEYAEVVMDKLGLTSSESVE